MVYIRRYLSGQQATTVTIAQGAITTDKIVDKAVTQPKVADDAITSDKIATGAVESEEIKDGEVKTADIASGAVTTDKIASQAVTVDKLEASIQGIARPLTPGVSSDEIAAGAVVASKIGAEAVETTKIKDGNVSAAKLAADAVETVKIKDSNVTTAKIAGGAVTETKVGANAVTGSKILNRSVGTTEIAINGVEAENVKDRNITSPKIALLGIIPELIAANAVTEPKLDTPALARRHIESFLIRTNKHFEEFGGVGISNKWVKTGDAGGSVLPIQGKGINIKTAVGSGKTQRIDWGGNREYAPDEFSPTMAFLIPSRGAGPFHLTSNLGLWNDANNHIVFYAHDVGGAPTNWFAKCVEGGVPTTIDTGVTVKVTPQEFMIEYLSDISVKFYINGVLVATVPTNIPSTATMEPRFEIISRTAAYKGFALKDFLLLGTKEVGV